MPYSHLFQEGNIGACRLRNRVIMPLYPTKYPTDSRVNDRMLAFYRERAGGGVAMIVLDGFCLDYPSLYKGRNELRADGPSYIEGIKELLKVIHGEGAKAFMHLNYPKERMSDTEVSGAKQKGDKWVLPLANNMTSEEAYAIIDTMAKGASKAKELGYDGVEIQASYGDLISQLLSPLTNRRTDEFGGPPENRARFLIDLIKWVKEAAGNDFPVMLKLVCDEFVPGGVTVKDSIETIRMAVSAGADAILANAGNKSTKNMTIPSHYTPPGALVNIAAEIKKAVDIPVIAIGKINTPESANEIIGEGKADFAAMARALVADPRLPQKALEGRREEIRGCIYCLQDCAQSGVPGFGRGCTVNPFAGQEYLSEIRTAEKKKKIAIIGGGPAGMQAALIASQRGHEVKLYERKDTLGGQFLFAAMAPFKDEVSELLRYLNYMLSISNVNVVLNTAAGVHEIAALGPDAVILATGSRSRMPDIPGADLDFVHDVREVYESSVLMPYLHSPGRRIVILGGGDIGCETADMLAGEGRDITIVEILPDALSKTKDIPKEDLLKRLKRGNVKIMTETEAVSIEPGKVRIKDKGGNLSFLPADSVIVSIGIVSENFLSQPLKEKIPEVYAIGDAAEPGNVGTALRSALKAALSV
ncbi:MAG: FAD-dependent oxidoreductase [Nitrospirae bacterium]|nr:FAD-dependent oxidoreductase [Nitrospirota bacterium]